MIKKMPDIFIVTEKSEEANQLCRYLTEEGYICSLASSIENAPEEVAASTKLILVNSIHMPGAVSLYNTLKTGGKRPVLALISQKELNDNHMLLASVDDFVVEPFKMPEIRLRIERLLDKTKRSEGKDIIKCGELTIDTTKYEVYVGETPVVLTFTEYELLKFLASNKGHVFSREALLNKVWGYDYYGGDRTVDVHIKRLRSKIEISGQTFIETVRSIGYRFKDL